jgi:hypothetical protein
MKLFEVKDWKLRVRDEAWSYPAFKKILDRDKTKDKSRAMKEMFFLWSYADIKSDFMYITILKDREVAVRDGVGLPKTWKLDKTVQEAVDFYTKHSITVIGELYQAVLSSVGDITDYLKNTKMLLAERDASGKPVYQLTAITGGVKSVRTIMVDLKSIYTEVVKEQVELDGRSKGAKTFNEFEDGLDF